MVLGFSMVVVTMTSSACFLMWNACGMEVEGGSGSGSGLMQGHTYVGPGLPVCCQRKHMGIGNNSSGLNRIMIALR